MWLVYIFMGGLVLASFAHMGRLPPAGEIAAVLTLIIVAYLLGRENGRSAERRSRDSNRPS